MTEIDDTPLLEMDYDALGRRIATRDYADDRDPWDTDACGTGLPTGEPLATRHVYSGVETIEEYVWCDGATSGEWKLAREFLWFRGREAGTSAIQLSEWVRLFTGIGRTRRRLRLCPRFSSDEGVLWTH